MTRLLLALAAALVLAAVLYALGLHPLGGLVALLGLLRRRAPDRSAQDAIAADAREERQKAEKRADDQLASDKSKGAKAWFDQFGRGP